MSIIQSIKFRVKRFTKPSEKVFLFMGNSQYRKHVVFDYSRFKLNKFGANENSVSPWLYDSYPRADREKALEKGINWLLTSQRKSNDDGSGSYHIINGWTPSGYPETTGYIIPTLLLYARLYKRPDIVDNAKKMGEWLLSIQKENGGWASGYAHQNRDAVVFNTGQILRGMAALYELTKEEKYLKAMERACDWLCDIQSPDGYWQKHVYLNMIRVYDSYVAFPMLLCNRFLKKQKIEDAVRKHIYWIIDKKQHENAWFEDADNTVDNNLSPILHTVSYTTDGILECGYELNDQKMIDAGKKAADVLFHKFNKQKFLFDKFDKNWKSVSQYINLTGSAQIAIIWSRLSKKLNKAEYLNASMKMNDLLIFTQTRFKGEPEDSYGAIAGSFPIWGDYQQYNFPNWATKYFCDSLMLEFTYTDSL